MKYIILITVFSVLATCLIGQLLLLFVSGINLIYSTIMFSPFYLICYLLYKMSKSF